MRRDLIALLVTAAASRVGCGAATHPVGAGADAGSDSNYVAADAHQDVGKVDAAAEAAGTQVGADLSLDAPAPEIAAPDLAQPDVAEPAPEDGPGVDATAPDTEGAGSPDSAPDSDSEVWLPPAIVEADPQDVADAIALPGPESLDTALAVPDAEVASWLDASPDVAVIAESSVPGDTAVPSLPEPDADATETAAEIAAEIAAETVVETVAPADVSLAADTAADLAIATDLATNCVEMAELGTCDVAELCEVKESPAAKPGEQIVPLLCKDMNTVSITYESKVSSFTLKGTVWIAYLGSCG